MSASLPPHARGLFDQLLSLADRRRVAAYLVGGPLRDLLLDRPSLDLDIAVEGDAMGLAREFANASRRDAPKARLGAGAGETALRIQTHPAFLTATVRSERFHLDLITARSEIYTRPGALPTVKPATIREDLLRRDFTVNALALRLNGADAGEVLDPAGGLADFDAKLVRALHERSFQDDATRILRAIRYATRLGFDVERETFAWLKRDVRYLDTISAARLHHEFVRIFAEDTPAEALGPLHDIGALAAIHPSLRFGPKHVAAFARLRDLHPTGTRAAYWPVLAWRLAEPEASALARRLALTRAQRRAAEVVPALDRLVSRRDAPKARLGTTPPFPANRSAVAQTLSPFPLPALWAFAALTDDPTVRNRLLDYLTKARHERAHLTGDDLLAMGVPQGPQLGEILRRLRQAKLDGEVKTREDEERLVRKLVAAAPSGLPRRAGARTPLPVHPEVSKE